MPTEDFDEVQARFLLAKAAATIDVDETTPVTLSGLPEPGHRRWPVLAAAAAVVLAIGGGYLVSQQLGDDPQLAPAPGNRERIEKEESALDDDQLPGLIGYTEDEAIELLQSRGYAVEVHVVPEGCNVAGIVTGATPAVGTRMEPGDAVTLRVVGQQDVIDCVGEVPWSIVWDVVRSARGLAEPATLARAEFPDEVRTVVQQLVSTPAEGLRPRLAATWAFEPYSCWPRPGQGGVRLWVDTGEPGKAQCPATSVIVEYKGNEVTQVHVETADPDDPPGLTEDRENAATAFAVWANGEIPTPPEFADRVRVMYGGGPAFGSTGWADDPDDMTQYAGCSGLGFPDCGLDPVALLDRHGGGPLRVIAGRSTCADGGTVPQRFADAPLDAVHIEVPEPGDCQRAWAVELWIDADGVIYGVNQAGG